MKILLFSFVLLALTGLSNAVFAQNPGALDSIFGTNGYVFTDFGSS